MNGYAQMHIGQATVCYFLGKNHEKVMLKNYIPNTRGSIVIFYLTLKKGYLYLAFFYLLYIEREYS